jgi:carboxypeptidase T
VQDDEPRYVSSLNGYFNYTVRNIGMDIPASFTVSITPLSLNITSVASAKTYSSLVSFAETLDSLSYTLDPTTYQGQAVQYILTISNGTYTLNDTVNKIYGQPVLVFSSDGNSMTGWQSSTGWGIDNNVFFSSTGSIADSPNGDYGSDDSTRIRTINQVDLTGSASATLSYMTRFIIEPRFDYAEVMASSDNGATYNPLCGKYTKTGNLYQHGGEPIYDGYQFAWVREEVDLDAFTGKNILLRFMMRADNYNEADGFYFDDLKVEKILGSSGVNEVNGGLEFSISPNPTQGKVQVTGCRFQVNSISVTDILGQQVIPELTPGNKFLEFDLSENAKGIYFVKVTDEKGNFGVKKIILQ